LAAKVSVLDFGIFALKESAVQLPTPLAIRTSPRLPVPSNLLRVWVVAITVPIIGFNPLRVNSRIKNSSVKRDRLLFFPSTTAKIHLKTLN
jgi:hypothetical protein